MNILEILNIRLDIRHTYNLMFKQTTMLGSLLNIAAKCYFITISSSGRQGFDFAINHSKGPTRASLKDREQRKISKNLSVFAPNDEFSWFGAEKTQIAAGSSGSSTLPVTATVSSV